MQPVRGVVQHYAWGDEEFIPTLLGVEPDGRPWAELWLGTHPHGPATVDGRQLVEIAGPLPYLLKVLSAAEPLSLQAHPTKEQAEAGFRAGRYADDQPKPELLVALTRFEALCGFRPVAATLDLLEDVGADHLRQVITGRGLGEALAGLLRRDIPSAPAVAAAVRSERPEARRVRALAERYPHDPGVAVALLLNQVVLSAGEALFLGPGNLHAYLRGAGIELMGASDNVVRGGLTAKPLDIDELLTVVDFTPVADPVRPPSDVYELDGTSIRLLRLSGPVTHLAAAHELVITSRGETGYLPPGGTLTVPADVTAHIATTTPPVFPSEC